MLCPWEQLPDEPEEAYQAFAAYLSEQDPSLAAFARTSGLPRTAVLAWSARHRWRARRAAYQRHLADVRFRAAEETAQEMGARHAAVLHELYSWSLESIEARRASGEVLKPGEIERIVRTVIEQERLARGEATQIVRDLSSVPDDVLDQLEEALRAAEDASEKN